MISYNGLCLKNTWMETKVLGFPDVLSTGHPTGQCLHFGVCCVFWAYEDAKVPDDRRICLCFPSYLGKGAHG